MQATYDVDNHEYTSADKTPIRIRRTDSPPRIDHRDIVQSVAASLALRLQHSILTRILDGTATPEDRAELASIAAEQAKEESGGTRMDMLALARLASGLSKAHYDGRWRHASASDIRSARAFSGV